MFFSLGRIFRIRWSRSCFLPTLPPSSSGLTTGIRPPLSILDYLAWRCQFGVGITIIPLPTNPLLVPLRSASLRSDHRHLRRLVPRDHLHLHPIPRRPYRPPCTSDLRCDRHVVHARMASWRRIQVRQRPNVQQQLDGHRRDRQHLPVQRRLFPVVWTRLVDVSKRGVFDATEGDGHSDGDGFQLGFQRGHLANHAACVQVDRVQVLFRLVSCRRAPTDPYPMLGAGPRTDLFLSCPRLSLPVLRACVHHFADLVAGLWRCGSPPTISQRTPPDVS